MMFGLCFQTASAVFFVEQAADVVRLVAAVLPVDGRPVADAEGFDGLVAVHEFHPLPVAPAAVFAAGNPFADSICADAGVADFAFGKLFFLFAAQVVDVPGAVDNQPCGGVFGKKYPPATSKMPVGVQACCAFFLAFGHFLLKKPSRKLNVNRP